MRSIMIVWKKRDDLWPRFGHADYDRSLAEVRFDLPWPARFYIIAHEIYHLCDKKGGHKETRATFMPLLLIPTGFLMVCFMRLKDRLWKHL